MKCYAGTFCLRHFTLNYDVHYDVHFMVLPRDKKNIFLSITGTIEPFKKTSQQAIKSFLESKWCTDQQNQKTNIP